MEQKEYFVIFISQPGEIKPSYSFMDEETLNIYQNQGIIAAAYPVSPNQVHTPEEVEQLLNKYLWEQKL